MKIKEVEQMTGITSHNIRFYEKENLISPQRNSENGYREYTERDVERLNVIKLLRLLDVPVKSIRDCLEGRTALGEILEGQVGHIGEQVASLKQNQVLCESLLELNLDIETVPRELPNDIWTDKEEYLMQLERIRKSDRRSRRIFTIKQMLCIIGNVILIVAALLFWVTNVRALIHPFAGVGLVLCAAVTCTCIIRMIWINETG